MSAFSPIQLQPSMDYATLINAINDNFRQIEMENRRQVIRDENGNQAIVFGRQEDGTYGLSLYDSTGKEVLRMGIQPGGQYGFSMYDKDGDERIRLGQQPDGSIKLVQTKPGYGIEEVF